MKTLIICLISLCFVSQTLAHTQDQILNAIELTESSGNVNVEDGDGGKAIGVFQIHEDYWKDATQYDKSIGGCYNDCRKPEYARKIVIAYMKRYCPTAYKNCDAQVMARIHNGGPKGNRKTSTLCYWERVRKNLKK